MVGRLAQGGTAQVRTNRRLTAIPARHIHYIGSQTALELVPTNGRFGGMCTAPGGYLALPQFAQNRLERFWTSRSGDPQDAVQDVLRNLFVSTICKFINSNSQQLPWNSPL